MTSLAERTYHQLSQDILSRRLQGGEMLVEGRLAETMGVSRTPMREALSRLVGAGLLVRQGNSAFAVRQVSAREFFQALKVRVLLEPAAAALAAASPDTASADLAGLRARVAQLSALDRQTSPHWEADDAVHSLVAGLANNPVLARMIGELRRTTRLLEMLKPFDRVADDGQEHQRILLAVEARDPDGARRAMTEHLRQLEAFVIGRLSE